MSNAQSTYLEDQIGQLGDRQAITELIAQLGVMLDEKRFDEARSILTDDVTAQTPGGSSHGREAVTAQAQRSHTVGTQHVITDVLIELDGDTAEVRANLIATFAPDRPDSRLVINGVEQSDPYLTVGARYRFGAVRTEDGWRLARIENEPLWSSQPRTRGAVVTQTSS
jgi:SnoaL-like domain